MFGACIGSFLNVVIYRLPNNLSIVWPASRCPVCETPIRMTDNIPILSYLFLAGKCRQCRSRIPGRYPLVELLTGLAAVASVLKFGPAPAALVYFGFIAALIVVTYIDIDVQKIYDKITLPGIATGLVAAALLPQNRLLDSLLGVLVGGGSLYLVAWLYYMWKQRDGMGGGDIKLLAMIGAFIGWKGVILTIFIASFTGTVVGLMQMALSRNSPTSPRIPFGPFLSVGAVTCLFYGKDIIAWYLQSFQ